MSPLRMTSNNEKQVRSDPSDSTSSKLQAFPLSNDAIDGINRNKSESKDATVHAIPEEPKGPPLEAPIQQQWNHPRINVWRVLAACYGLLMMGMNDAAYGALIPYIESYYDIDYTIVSLIFLSPFLGYTVAALTINQIHMKLGQRGIASIGPGMRVLAYIVISQHPPYPVLVIVFIIAGYGNGLEDGAWNAWIGDMQNANEVLGFLHGAYGLGGTLSPLIATAMITKGLLPWYTFYYIMIGLAVGELIAAVTAFWKENGKKFRADHPRTNDVKGGRTKEALKSRIIWICAAFLLIYVGIEVSIGGWVVTFMINIRHSTPFAAGMAETGFWLGITLGRVILGFVTPRIGEKLAILIYLAAATALHLMFYLIPNQYVSFVAVALEGFFLAPLFPAAVVAATKLLPQHLHVAGIGFAAACGAAGACVLPFAVGAIAQAKGVQVLMPIVLVMLGADAAVWACLPSLKKTKGASGEVGVE